MTSFEDLKELRNQVHEKNLQNLVELSKITDLALERLENHSCNSENEGKAKALLGRLKDLCDERERVYLNIQKNHALLEEKYKEAKIAPSPIDSDIQKQRDQAFELAKRMLAVLKSANVRIEENAKKVKSSADLMFHVMYKVEDKYVQQ